MVDSVKVYWYGDHSKDNGNTFGRRIVVFSISIFVFVLSDFVGSGET
jgi:hypothetical protein